MSVDFPLFFAYVIEMKNGALFSPVIAILEWLSKPALVFYLMPVLMVLLTVGTLAQAEMGLYDAHQKYFSSFIFWEYGVPLPGGYTLLGLLTLNLLLKFLFFSEWKWRKSGIIVAHLGALLLLLGGLLTALTAREGFMVIAEGEASPFVYDYHARELRIFENDQALYTIPYDALQAGTDLAGLDLPFDLRILKRCDNCDIQKREENTQGFAPDVLRSMAQFMALEPKAKEKEAEVNMSGVTLEVITDGTDVDFAGIYLAFEGMPKPVEFDIDDHNYKMTFGKQQRELPFQIRLEDFKKVDYPGTEMAKAYSSDVVVLDEGSNWKARIEMNAPLRYKGYTFYQSSFDQSGPAEMTVLSVVENQGRIFPYLGTFVITLGLLWHLLILAKRGNTT